jgi:ABC-type Zn uptake system ZnuABC Zn-binding protein ZnuA
MILICLLAAAAVLAGCGDGGGAEGPGVVATTAVATDIVRHVAGPDVHVETLLPRGASPHDFGASAKDRAELDEADLVVAWGAGLEAGLPLDDVDPVELARPQDESDPHVWMDPTRIADDLPRIAAALAERDPEGAAGYRRRARSYARRLDTLDRELRRTIATIPPRRRTLVTSHDELGHFADRYGLEVIGTPFGRAPGSEPNAETVSDLIARVKREHVRAVFAESTEDPEVVDQIAREAHVEVVDDLLVEGFGGGVDSYAGMLRFDARRIAKALGR